MKHHSALHVSDLFTDDFQTLCGLHVLLEALNEDKAAVLTGSTGSDPSVLIHLSEADTLNCLWRRRLLRRLTSPESELHLNTPPGLKTGPIQYYHQVLIRVSGSVRRLISCLISRWEIKDLIISEINDVGHNMMLHHHSSLKHNTQCDGVQTLCTINQSDQSQTDSLLLL